ncbi:paraquat-inducible protein B [Rhodobacter aestuarii]|uniref:Paraquat-inducible protein B n=1 Tax=Rhodobacter aestuarii TaxID=453582 RepID=A0A1N7NGR7_9RHOB|nr:MlaD family protein [Rhodobacter aestuarii]PTV96461.1 paraquat-inducible protein B [Rhodobacter aestuarii]SIS97544.1 paraquat-inducible protein B [Rhodobacter aestuarii]
MSIDPNQPSTPAQPEITAAPASWLSRFSIVWVVPILALIVSLGVAWKTFHDRGVPIQITFSDAAGLVPGQSVLKYRQVVVGKVEKVGFTEDLTAALVTVRVDQDMAAHIDSEAQFWLARPQIGFSGISGLDTVLSGAFIEGLWDKRFAGPPPAIFKGLETPPLAVTPGSGTWITLTAPDGGSLIEGAPVLYRGIKVGQLRNLRVNPTGDGVRINAFIEAPYDKRLTSSTLFWNTSGFSVSLGASGVKLNVRSLSSLIQGGVEFNTLVTGGAPLGDSPSFPIFTDEETARDSIFADTAEARVALSIRLDGSIRGLALGDPVNLRGVKVGEIINIGIETVTGTEGDETVVQRVDFAVTPERLGLPRKSDTEAVLALLSEEVSQKNLRARVASSGLLGSSLVVELVAVKDAEPASIDLDAKPNPVLPTTAPDISDFSASAEGVLARINALPIEEVMDSTISLLDTTTKLIGQEETQQVPGAILGLVEDARGVISSPDLQAAPAALRKALEETGDFMADLAEAGTVDSITGAMTTASEAAQAVTDSVAGVPKLIDTLNEIGETAKTLPLQEITQNAADLTASLNKLASSADMEALPKSLTESLDALTVMLKDLEQGGATENLNQTLGSAREAADAVAEASTKLPDLTTKLERVIRNLDGVLASYGERSDFNTETVATLRQLRKTAASFDTLIRMIQRNPQSIILGR